MPLENHPWKVTPEQWAELADYCKAHGINKSTAGRIALARLLAKKPTAKEIEASEVTRGTPENIKRYNERRDG